MIEAKSLLGAVVLPSYNETHSISKLILDLDLSLPPHWHMVVVDDSPNDETYEYVLKAFNKASRDASNLHILRNEGKSGRGAAVQRGMSFCINYLKPDFIVEMDSDGSHTVESVMRLVHAPKTQEFVIGSRYVKGSRIDGWPLLRRVFSILTNKVLRLAFRSQLSDWTNGLRRYSTNASLIQLDHKFINKGFICLSEQVLLLGKHGIDPIEVPIHFVDRTHGASTITHMEVLQSVRGILGLYRHWR